MKRFAGLLALAWLAGFLFLPANSGAGTYLGGKMLAGFYALGIAFLPIALYAALNRKAHK